MRDFHLKGKAGSMRRRDLLLGGVSFTLGAGTMALLSGCSNGVVMAERQQDQQILTAAKIAEALAIAMYTQFINNSPIFAQLPRDDQDYFRAARDAEMRHYEVLRDATNSETPVNTFYFPKNMFTDPQVTINTMLTLEEIFIPAYLIAVNDLSNNALKVLAARIMGVEAEHKVLIRAVAAELGLTTVTTLVGSEPVKPPNNVYFERRFASRFAKIDDIVKAAQPFINRDAANQAGFDLNNPVQFQPYTPPANPNGDLNT